jgi:hypothetical protein
MVFIAFQSPSPREGFGMGLADVRIEKQHEKPFPSGRAGPGRIFAH